MRLSRSHQQLTVHLDVLDGCVVGQPVGQRRRPLARDSVETHVQVGEGVVDTQSFAEAEGPLVAQPVSSEAQPPQLLRWARFGRGFGRVGLRGAVDCVEFFFLGLRFPSREGHTINQCVVSWRHVLE